MTLVADRDRLKKPIGSGGHGRRVACVGRAPAPRRGPQDAAHPGRPQRPGTRGRHRPGDAGGPHHGRAAPPARGHRVRRGGARGAAVHRDATGGVDAAVGPPPGARHRSPVARRRADRRRGCAPHWRRPTSSAHRAPRRQTGQHPHHRGRLGDDQRLRHLARARRHHDHRDGDGARHPRLPRPGGGPAGSRRASRRTCSRSVRRCTRCSRAHRRSAPTATRSHLLHRVARGGPPAPGARRRRSPRCWGACCRPTPSDGPAWSRSPPGCPPCTRAPRPPRHPSSRRCRSPPRSAAASRLGLGDGPSTRATRRRCTAGHTAETERLDATEEPAAETERLDATRSADRRDGAARRGGSVALAGVADAEPTDVLHPWTQRPPMPRRLVADRGR